FGQIARDVVGTQKYFQCASSSDQTRQPRHRAASRNYTRPDFPLRQDGFFATRKAHVAGQGQLTSDTGSPTPNRCYRNNWRASQGQEHVWQGLQTSGPGRQAGRVLESCQEVVVS